MDSAALNQEGRSEWQDSAWCWKSGRKQEGQDRTRAWPRCSFSRSGDKGGGEGCKDPGSGTARRQGAWEPWGSSFTVYSVNGSPSLGPDSTPLSDKRVVGLEFPSTLLMPGTQCSTCTSPAEERASRKGRSADRRQKSCAQGLPGVASVFPLGPTSSHQGRCL